MTSFVTRQSRIIGAMLMREVTTRFGREGLGFAWLIGEPLIFCFGVLILWTATKPEYEHGIRLAPFVMTGYMSLILIRHMVGYLSGALQGNAGLMFHRQIAPIHIFASRILLEIGGTTAAFFVVYVILLLINQVSLPHDYLLLYAGWGLLAWTGAGFALILTGLAMRFEIMERLVGLISYAMIPLSGAFAMAAWIPASVREYYLYIPFVHGIEMIRGAIFDEFVPVFYDPLYALAVGTVMVVLGMLLISGARGHVDIE